MKIESYKDLEVWKKAMDLVIMVYQLTDKLPPDERFGLISQMRRAVMSIPSNIAEGQRRRTRRDYAKFVSYAFGSGAELETQFEAVIRLGYLQGPDTQKATNLLDEVMRMLNSMLTKLEGAVATTTNNPPTTTI